MGAADSTRNVHLFLRDVVPEPPARPIQRFIACQPRHIRHAGIQINRTHGMSERLVLLAHRQMRLIIEITKFVLMPFFYFFGMLLIKVVGTLSALVHEIPGKV